MTQESTPIAHDEEDILCISMWMNCDERELKISLHELPISAFQKQIDEMMASYPKFPYEEARTKKIFHALKSGEPIRPVYVEEADESSFVMEGRHRLVAQSMLGRETIWVAKVSVRPAEKPTP